MQCHPNVAGHILLREIAMGMITFTFVVKRVMRRIYKTYAAYFITTNPKERFPYFDSDVLTKVLLDVLAESEIKKDFYTIGYKVNPDHIHLLIQVRNKFNISDVMHNIKRISSIRLNQVLCYDLQEHTYQNLRWTNDMEHQRQAFIDEVGNDRYELPLFKWERDFHDRIISSASQMKRTIQYLKNQSNKHNLDRDTWLCINSVPRDIIY